MAGVALAISLTSMVASAQPYQKIGASSAACARDAGMCVTHSATSAANAIMRESMHAYVCDALCRV